LLVYNDYFSSLQFLAFKATAGTDTHNFVSQTARHQAFNTAFNEMNIGAQLNLKVH
jgi:hypothetical protein